MGILDFLDYAKKHPDEFRNYCEIIIDDIGGIHFAHPSHQEKTLRMYCKKHNMTKEQFLLHLPNCYSPFHWILQKERWIGVWYNTIIMPYEGMNRFQLRTIELLKRNGLISSDFHAETTNEYKLYLYREEGIEE